jgi:hypothetical protein
MIYIECDADEVLVKELGFGRKQFIHEGGKFGVCKRLQNVKNSIGLIEHDKGVSDPLYLRKCILIADDRRIKIYQEKISGNKLIILFNDLEEWVLTAAKNSRIDVTKEYGLPANGKSLHREMPTRLESFKKLIARLLVVQNQDVLFLQSKLQSK